MGKQKKWAQTLILAALLLVGGFTIGRTLFEGNAAAPQPGGQAPEFTVKGIDGNTYKLGSLKGKPVVLNFWATYCEPCAAEMPALQRQADRWTAEGVHVIGMNLAENAVTVQGFLREYNLRFPIYMDKDESIRKAYGVYQYPTTFFIRPDGTVMEIKIGGMSEDYIAQTISALLDLQD